MDRSPTSHKGENGKVAVIGGSRFQHGAPLFAALSAEASGVDLLYVALPLLHAEAAKLRSLNFQVHPFQGDDLGKRDVDSLLELLATVDCAVIGPGLARSAGTLDAVRSILSSASCPLVLDASALQQDTLDLVRQRTVVLTPHRGELERMGIAMEKLSATVRSAGVTLHLKGPVDQIVAPDGSVEEVAGGNAGLTVGGTGDALAGLIAGLIAQRVLTTEACAIASRVIKGAGEELSRERGFSYRTEDVIARIPHLLHRGADAPPMTPYKRSPLIA